MLKYSLAWRMCSSMTFSSVIENTVILYPEYCHSLASSVARAVSPVDGQRRAGGDELLVAQIAPEVVRDDGGKCGAVFRNSLGSAGTRDDRSRGGMSEREPQRGGLDGDPMALGDGLDAFDLREDL